MTQQQHSVGTCSTVSQRSATSNELVNYLDSSGLQSFVSLHSLVRDVGPPMRVFRLGVGTERKQSTQSETERTAQH